MHIVDSDSHGTNNWDATLCSDDSLWPVSNPVKPWSTHVEVHAGAVMGVGQQAVLRPNEADEGRGAEPSI